MHTGTITREYYLNEIKRYVSKPLIKVITGMRRIGKTYLLRQIKDLLLELEPQSNIIYIDKESLDFDFIRNYQDLNTFIENSFGKSSSRKYLLIDEVQEIEGWEKSIASAHGSGVDVYITGSNANLLSSDLATLLSGRYVKFQLYALGFKEFIEFNRLKDLDPEIAFQGYLRYGGLPAIASFYGDEKAADSLIHDVFDTILLKDIIQRHKIRDVSLLKKVIYFLFDNIGNVFSAKKVADYLKSQRVKLGIETIYNYIEYIVSTYAIDRVQRYDIKGKRHLEISEKYYLGDISLRHAFLGFRQTDINAFLENLVYLSLLRRGYKVYIGKFDNQEIDFIAESSNDRIYIQVSYLLASEDVTNREFGPLMAINDNYTKIVLSMDKFYGENHHGIKRLNLIEWLLEESC